MFDAEIDDDFEDDIEEGSGRETRNEACRRVERARVRNECASDLLLAALFKHHPDHAIAALKGIEPKVIDLEPPPPPPEGAEIIPFPAQTAETMPYPPMLTQIIQAVCAFYKISMNDLCSPRRTADAVAARHMFMYLGRKHTAKSLPQIGRMIGKDHTTILHGANKIASDLKLNNRLQDEVELIEMRLSKTMLMKIQHQLDEAVASAEAAV